MEELAVGRIVHHGRVRLYWHRPSIYTVDWRCEHDGLPYGLRDIEQYPGEPPEDIEERLVLKINDLYERGELFS